MHEPTNKNLREVRHDLRNELSSIRNAAFYIRRRLSATDAYLSDPRIHQFFDLIESSISRASDIVEVGLESRPDERTTVAYTSTRERFLVVEDDDSNGLTLAALLEEEGFVVDLARSAAEARDRLLDEESSFDVVLLDNNLGDGLGCELVQLIRQQSPESAIVLMSGSDEPALDEVFADARFMKGDPPRALLETIGSLLRGT